MKTVNEQTRDQLEADLAMVKVLTEVNPLYPIEDLNFILRRIKLNAEFLMAQVEQPRIGQWVQIHERHNKPYYGKIEAIPEPGYYTMEGLYATQNGKLVQRAIRQDMCAFVSTEVGRVLEFVNDINTIKPQDYKFGVNND